MGLRVRVARKDGKSVCVRLVCSCLVGVGLSEYKVYLAGLRRLRLYLFAAPLASFFGFGFVKYCSEDRNGNRYGLDVF